MLLSTTEDTEVEPLSIHPLITAYHWFTEFQLYYCYKLHIGHLMIWFIRFVPVHLDSLLMISSLDLIGQVYGT